MANLKRWDAWLFGLVGAIKGAIATAGLTYLASLAGGLDLKWRQFCITVGFAALVQGFMYIQKSPMPFEITEETTTTTATVETTTKTTESKQNENTPPSPPAGN
jgi:NhaP-type Na+/H+ or K+/H+ antiporter